MATTTTNLTPAAELFGFTGLPGALQERSAVPRQEVIFNIIDGDITVAAGGADQDLSITCNLPVNFSYALMEVHLAINGADAADWGNSALAIWTDGDATDRTIACLFEGTSKGVAGTSSSSFGALSRQYTFADKPTVILLPANEPKLVLKVANSTIDGAAMNTHFMARMLMFDIDQAHHWEVNTPMPIR